MTSKRLNGILAISTEGANTSASTAAKQGSLGELILAQDDLGEVIDKVIAKRLGCCVASVATYRNRAGIPPFRSEFSPHHYDSAPHYEPNELSPLLLRWGR